MPEAAERYVALLRAINVGGHGRLTMADLLGVAQSLRLAAPRTILQTGNLCFTAPAGDAAALEAALETGVAERGVISQVMVRSAADWAAIVAGNPFAAEAREDPSRLIVLVLKRLAVPGAETALAATIKGRERVGVASRVAYVMYPDGIGRSKLTASVLERHLGSSGTGRNWRTVAKIAAALGV